MSDQELPERLHEHLRQWLALGGDLASLSDLMMMREAEASAAIDRTGHARTFHVESEEDETP